MKLVLVNRRNACNRKITKKNKSVAIALWTLQRIFAESLTNQLTATKSQVEFLIKINHFWVQVLDQNDKSKIKWPWKVNFYCYLFFITTAIGQTLTAVDLDSNLKVLILSFLATVNRTYDLNHWKLIQVLNSSVLYFWWLIKLSKDDQFDFNFFSMLIEGGFHFVPPCRFIPSH